jgi:hypothetical protein
MRILSSRIQPLAENADKDHVKTMLIKKIQEKPKPKRGTTQQEQQRFEELYSKFQRTKSIKNQNAMLQLLL